MDINPGKTAIKRKEISSPLKYLLQNNLINKKQKILDYGCGYGKDTDFLRKHGYQVNCYDKYQSKFQTPVVLYEKYDIVLCFYVLNVIIDIKERIEVLELLNQVLEENGKIYLVVRTEKELSPDVLKKITPYKDGFVTCKKTFQKYFNENEFINFVSQVIKNKKVELIEKQKYLMVTIS